jgi:hypothetical protein
VKSEMVLGVLGQNITIYVLLDLWEEVNPMREKTDGFQGA